MRHLVFLLSFIALKTIAPTSSSRSREEYLSANLFFVGVSKCGTTSITETLLAHPLISAVGGNQKGVLMAGRESRLFGHFPEEKVIVEQDKRIRFHLLNKTKRGGGGENEIKKRGRILHYTPNYSILPDLAEMILSSLKTLQVPLHTVRFIFALRNPVTRTESSWWYKEHCYQTKSECPSFSSQVEKGIAAARLLERCYETHNRSLHALVTDIASLSSSSPVSTSTVSITSSTPHSAVFSASAAASATLKSCPNTLLIPEGSTNLKVAHVGKSLYIHQLLHWYHLIPPSQIYLLSLESYQTDPLTEIELLLRWLGLPRYGPSGYNDRESLRNLTQRRFNAYPIPGEVRERELTSEVERRLEEFYGESVRELRRFWRTVEGRSAVRGEEEERERDKEGKWMEFVEEMRRGREGLLGRRRNSTQLREGREES
jgi:hypothetical protein